VRQIDKPFLSGGRKEQGKGGDKEGGGGISVRIGPLVALNGDVTTKSALPQFRDFPPNAIIYFHNFPDLNIRGLGVLFA